MVELIFQLQSDLLKEWRNVTLEDVQSVYSWIFNYKFVEDGEKIKTGEWKTFYFVGRYIHLFWIKILTGKILDNTFDIDNNKKRMKKEEKKNVYLTVY